MLDVAMEKAKRELRCSQCKAALEDCAFCNEPDCPAPVCHGCIDVALSPEAPPRRRKEAGSAREGRVDDDTA